jgi:hypothetical protein
MPEQTINPFMPAPDWYRDTKHPLLEKVTNLPTNIEVGLNNILLFQPSDMQAEEGMICTVILKMFFADIRCAVYQSRANPDTIFLTPPQVREETADGETCYHDEVKLHSALIAQVLRYVETQIELVEEGEEQL